MARKWLQLVSGDGKALTSATSVALDIEDVDSLRDAVKDKYKDSYLVGIAASDIKVFANRAAYDAKQSLGARDSLANIDENHTLIAQVPQKAESCMSMVR
jgi:hypothetical protein